MSAYYDDEYDGYDEEYAYFETYEQEAYGGEIKGWSNYAYLYKAPNGHLVMIEVSGYCLWGQDWGETVGQWNTDYFNLARLKPRHKLWAIYLGRDMQPGEQIDYYYPDIEEEISKKKAEISALNRQIDNHSILWVKRSSYVANLYQAEAELKALKAILEVERV